MLELKPFKHELDLKIGRKTFSFVYFDATLGELIEFMHLVDSKIDLNEWLLHFLERNNVKNGIMMTRFKKKHFNKISRKQKKQILLKKKGGKKVIHQSF